ncbi:MAG: ribosome silencing factor [Cryobacterium sp.]|nr:ribosome silencing factor [Oligoflexia bacterium]
MSDTQNETPGAATNPEGLAKALLSARAAIDKKAENVKLLDLSEISGFTDYFLICSGTSDRQVQAIGEAVSSALEVDGYELLSAEGLQDGRWVLMDFGDVIIHVFLDALREYYDLENLWKEAPQVRIPDEFYGQGVSRLN